MPVNMTGYPSVRKTAHHAPALAELEFARDTCAPIRTQELAHLVLSHRVECTRIGVARKKVWRM